MSKVVLGFDPNSIQIPLECILSSRKLPLGLLKSRKYRQILASVREVGVIEPLSVIPADLNAGVTTRPIFDSLTEAIRG